MPMTAGNLVAESPVGAMMPMPMSMSMSMPVPTAMAMMPEAFAKDAMLAWFRTEFAAANAIIDALCGHLSELHGGAGEYTAAFHEIHRRRVNWISVLQMQKYNAVGNIIVELRRIAAAKKVEAETDERRLKEVESENDKNDVADSCLPEEKMKEKTENHADCDDHEEVAEEYESPNSEVTDSGSQDVQSVEHVVEICDNHEDCEARLSQIKLTKGFNAKESVKSHMVNVVKGLKLYEDVFTEPEISKLRDCVNEMRSAGQNGELLGDTFILFNQQIKGNRRELIQLGVPIFGQVKDEAMNNSQTSNIEPIPTLLENVIDHMLQWKLIPEYKRPNGCIITFFEEGEYSQPFLKPPHLDQPISTLLLSESTMAFGRILSSDNDGNYKGALMLSLKEGSLLVMRGNSSDMARHVMCPSSNQRISITFFRVRPESSQCHSPTSPLSAPGNAMTMWQQGAYVAAPNGATYDPLAPPEMASKWGGVLRSPVIMLAPVRPVVLSPRRAPSPPAGNGTGVFLPWAMASRKPQKHLPPRAQKGRLLAKARAEETAAEPGNNALEKAV